MVITLPSSATVAELIAQGVASLKWHAGHAWFGEDMQPTKTLADYNLESMDMVLFTQDFAGKWPTHPQYEAVRAAAASKGTG